MSPMEINDEIRSIQSNREALEAHLRRCKTALTVDGRQNLERLLGDEYLKLQMNTRAMKSRILQRLKKRKFELERLEKSYRNVMHDMFTLFANIQLLIFLQIRTYPITFAQQPNDETLQSTSWSIHITRLFARSRHSLNRRRPREVHELHPSLIAPVCLR